MKKKSSFIKTLLFYSLIFAIVSLFFSFIYYQNHKLLLWQDDGFQQHVINLTSFREFLINFFKTGKIDSFYFNIGAGMDMFSNYAYYITGDIFSYTSIFLPASKMPLLYSALYFVRLYFAGLAFILYCRHKKYNSFSSIIGAIMYSFCTFALLGVFKHPYFANAMIIFPMVILALERLIDDNKPILYSIMIAIMFIMSFYFAYMLTIIIALYGIIYVIYKYKNEKIKKIITTFLKILLYSVIGVLISSAVLLPVINAFLNTERTTIQHIYPYYIAHYRNMINDLINIKGHGYWLYWGVQSIIFLTLPKFYRNKNKEFSYKLLLPILLLPILISKIGSMFCGFAFPNNRWSFIFPFIFAFMTSSVLNDGNFDKKDYINTSIFIMIFLFLDVIFNIKIANIILMQFLVLVALITLTKYKKVLENKLNKLNIYNLIFSGIFTIGILFSVNFSHNIVGTGYVKESVKIGNYNNLVNSANKTIPELNKSIDYLNLVDSDNYYRIMRYPYNLTNVAMLINFNQIGSYYSLTPQVYKDLADDLIIPNYYTSYGLKDFNYRTRITTLLGAKYLISAKDDVLPYSYKKDIDINKNNHIYINKNNLEFATLYTKYIDIDDYNKLTPLEKEISLTKQVALSSKTRKNNLKTKEIDYSKYIKKIDFKIIDDNKLIKNNKFKIKNEKKNTFKIKFDEIKDSELYIYIKGLKHEGFTKKEIIKSKLKNNNNKQLKNEMNFKYKWYFQNNAYAYSIQYKDVQFNKAVENNLTSPYYLDNDNYLLNLGYHEKFDEELMIKFFTSGKYSYDSIEIYAVKMDDYKDDIKKLNEANFKLDNYKNSYMKFSVEPTKDGILQLSTLYSDGFTIYIDGNKADTLKVNKYFLGTYITKGKHTIVLKYKTKFTKEGLICSIIGLISLLLLFIFRKPNNKQSLFMRFWNWGWGIYHKNEEIWNYLIVGGLTTVVSLGTYYLCVFTFLNPNNGLQLQCANIISWVFAVVFAYITNRKFVFKSKEQNIKKEATSFIGSRVLTLLLDMLLMFVLVTLLHFNDKFSKVFDQIIIVVANYIISKLIVFKK